MLLPFNTIRLQRERHQLLNQESTVILDNILSLGLVIDINTDALHKHLEPSYIIGYLVMYSYFWQWFVTDSLFA